MSISDKLKNKIQKITHLILDVDGVLTDGRIIYDDAGRELKCFDVKDGHGMKLLMRSGIDIILLTGRSSKVVEYRAKDLGIDEVYQGAKNKIQFYEQILSRKNLKECQTACMGDDLTDIPILRRAGFSAAPADASEYARRAVDYVTNKNGGYGAVREICELILQVQNKWDEVVARYSIEAHG
jgi:3-deoxy-D-manno-octulosonate 8-phosphate phosphatase (KDO 8-P phosphatase)